jgi:hypothetical protein
MPSAYLEEKRTRDAYVEQKAQLTTRLKNAFKCDHSTLQYRAEMCAQRFPHKGCLETAIRVATYLISTLNGMLNNTASTDSDGPNGTAFFVRLHKCAWIVYCLLQTRNIMAPYEIIIGLLLDEVIQAFGIYGAYSEDIRLPPASEPLAFDDYAIEDPLRIVLQVQDSQAPRGGRHLQIVCLANPSESLSLK